MTKPKRRWCAGPVREGDGEGGPEYKRCRKRPTGTGLYPRLCDSCLRDLCARLLDAFGAWIQYKAGRDAEARDTRELISLFELSNPDRTVTVHLSPLVREFADRVVWAVGPRPETWGGRGAAVGRDGIMSGYLFDREGGVTLYRWRVPDTPEVAHLFSAKVAHDWQRRDAAAIRGRAATEATERLALRIKAAADEYRAAHPYDREKRSTRRLSRDLARQLNVPAGTVRDHLLKQGIK